jgi:rhodanese-related sulfurtransferase
MEKTITPAELARLLEAKETVALLDVRRKEDYEKFPEGIGGAQWRDPAIVAQWMHALPKHQEVILYCVRGGSVSQSVQKQLSEADIKAKYLEGGLEAFKN